MPFLKSIVLLAILAISRPGFAASFTGGSGFAGSLALDTDFTDARAILGNDVPPGSFYAGVQFNEFLLGPTAFGGTGIRTRIALNPVSPIIQSSISFATPVTAIALLSRDAISTRFTAFLNGAQVESLTTLGAGYGNATFYGFTNSLFDEIRFTQDISPLDLDQRLLIIDRLQVSSVPLPLGIVLLASCLPTVLLRQRRARRTARWYRAPPPNNTIEPTR